MSEVVISNSSLNSYGFRVLTAGIDLTQYNRNPIMLWMHKRPLRGTSDEILPLGRMENLRIDGDNLIGTPVFDENDEFARKIKAKWDGGFLKMVSAGLIVVEQSDDPKLIVQGQRYATVTQSRLYEVSIVDIGSNNDAIALYDQNEQMIELASGKDNIFLTPINNKLNATQMESKTIALALGLTESATEQEVLQRAAQLRDEAAEVVQLRAQEQQRQQEAIALLVDGAIREGKFTADKRAHFIGLGEKVGLVSLKETIDLMSAAPRPSTVIQPSSEPTIGEYKKLSDVPTDKLELLRKENREQYIALYKAEYGIEPAMQD